MFAPHYQLHNLILIVDYNKLQGYGRSNEVLNLEPITDKFRSFNWHTIEIDGHDFKQIESALKTDTDKPSVIIAHTVKGKGVSFMENEFVWHYKSPDQKQLDAALKELL